MHRPAPLRPTFRLAALLCGVALGACIPDVRSGAAPRPLVVGERVLAPFSKNPNLFPGRITELYGNFALVTWDDGSAAYVPVGELEPRGLPLPDPPDTPRHAPGDVVLARWWRVPGKLYETKVIAVYGAIVHVAYDDGEHLWYRQEELLRPPVDRAAPIPAPPGGLPPPAIGARVGVRQGERRRPTPGRVAEVHGSLALIYPERGAPTWIDIARLEPQAGPGDVPAASMRFPGGARVLVPSPDGRGLREAVVEESYGKLLRVTDAEGERWVRGWEAEAR